MIRLAVARPVGVLVSVLLVLLFGVMSVSSIPIQLTPDIEVPTITVTTRWPGAAPAEVERDILQEQEEVLKTLQGLQEMKSQASQSQGEITLELAVGADMDQALVRVSNALAQVPNYPETAREPVLATSNNTGPPLAVILLQDPSGGDVGHYRTWAEDEVVSRLERVRGVAGTRYFGGRDTVVEVKFDPGALAARGVTVDALAASIQGALGDISAGTLDIGKRQYVVRTEVAPEIVSELEQLVLAVGDGGRIVRVADVAEVNLGLAKREAYVFGDDHESMAMLLSREAGYNVLDVTRQLYDVVEEVQREKLDPLGLELRIAADQVSYIEGALQLVEQNLALGGVLAIVVLLVFLRSGAASAVVATAIPVSVIGTALGMGLLGRSVNVVSLAGMAFAVGMVVDNAIVVLESIDTWRRRGVSAQVAAVEGTQEVWGAILASTLTTVAVFLPIVAWQDEVGELLRDVAIAVSLAVLISLVVSVWVIPSFAAKVLKPVEPHTTRGFVARAARWRDAIGHLASWVSTGWLRPLGVVIGAVGLAAIVGLGLLPPVEYLPTGNRNLLFGVLIPPPGYSVEELRQTGERFQAQLKPHTGQQVGDVPALERSFFVARPGTAFMGASALDPDRISELVDYYKAEQRKIPGAFGSTSQASLFGRNLGSSRSIDLAVSGGDLTELMGVGGAMMGRLQQVMPGAQIRPQPALDLGAPELQVVPHLDRLSAVGLTPAEVGRAVDALVDGRTIGELGRDGESQVDVLLRPIHPAETPEELAAMPLATPTGEVVPIGALVELHETVGPVTISRLERRRSVTLIVSPPDDVALAEALRLIEDDVLAPMRAAGELPTSIDVRLTGTADKLEEAAGRMGMTLLFALVISFLLLSALFEDFVAPLAILVTVPLAGAGGVVALRAVDLLLGPQPLDLMTALGFVILLGVVVNNAILVVDGALARLRDGEGLSQAVGSAVQRRVRPMLMSAMTSLAGLLPLVLFPGSGSELYRGVGAVVLGGLALSTVLTLVVVPAAFVLLWRLTGRAT